MINEEYGYVSLDRHSLFQLPRPVLREVMSTLAKYVSADISPIRESALRKLLADLDQNKVGTAHNCVFTVDSDTVCVAASHYMYPPVPISVGQEVHFIGKWKILLSSHQSETGSQHGQYFVRLFNNKRYATLLRKGVRVIRSAKLPPLKVRGGLPVITDGDGNVVAIPHFKVNDRTYGLRVTVQYSPLVSLPLAYQSNCAPVK